MTHARLASPAPRVRVPAGCSSVGGGLLSELGPFYPDPTGTKLVPNPYSWNTVANVLFVESPAGVGFSYSNNQSDYTVGDERSALDLWTLLQGFLQQFPQYTNTPFWISGESYGVRARLPRLPRRLPPPSPPAHTS